MTVSADVETVSLLVEYEAYLRSDSSREAFAFLRMCAQLDESYRFVPRRQGSVNRTVRYFLDRDVSPYGFIVNRDDLLFYFRKPSGRTSDAVLGSLVQSGLEVSRNNGNDCWQPERRLLGRS